MIRLLILLLTSVAQVVCAGRAAATTTIVLQGPGTPLQDAIDAASPGDTLLLDGVFFEKIVVDKPLTLSGRPFDAIDSLCAPGNTIDVTSDGVRLERLHVYGGNPATISINGRDDVSLKHVNVYPYSFGAVCSDSDYGIDVIASTNVSLRDVETFFAVGGEFYQQAFIRLSNIPADGRVSVSRSRSNNVGPIGILVEDSDDTFDVPWRGGLYGVRLLRNGVVTASTGIRLQNSTGVIVRQNYLGGATSPPGIGIHLDAASSANLVRRNTLANQNITDILDEGTANCLERNRYLAGGSDPPGPCLVP